MLSLWTFNAEINRIFFSTTCKKRTIPLENPTATTFYEAAVIQVADALNFLDTNSVFVE